MVGVYGSCVTLGQQPTATGTWNMQPDMVRGNGVNMICVPMLSNMQGWRGRQLHLPCLHPSITPSASVQAQSSMSTVPGASVATAGLPASNRF